MRRLRALAALLIVWTLPAAARQAPDPDRPDGGRTFAAMSRQVLLPGGSALEAITLRAGGSGRPTLILYFMLGEAIGEAAFADLRELADGPLSDKADLYAAVRLDGTAERTIERLSRLGASIPVIVEEDLALARVLGVTTAPSFCLIDAEGVLRIRDAKSLGQEVSRGMTLAEALARATRREPVPTVDRLPRYYPASELVGRPFPDFTLKRFGTPGTLTLSEFAGRGDGGKTVALLFWHPNCRHCKRAMPGLVSATRTFGDWIEVVSVADLKNADEARNAADTIRAHGVIFPVLQDEGRRVSALYKVISTPTMILVRPDGVVDSVHTSGNVDHVKLFRSRIRAISGRDLPGEGG